MFQNRYSIVPVTKSCDQIHCLSNLLNPSHQSIGFLSERFPVYPIQIIVCAFGHRFNKLQISTSSLYSPGLVKIYFSPENETYSEVGQLNFAEKSNKKYRIRSISFQNASPQYIKLKIMDCLDSKDNLCKQVCLYGLKIFNMVFKNPNYLYSLQVVHNYPPLIVRLLQNVQYLKLECLRDKNYEMSSEYELIIKDVLSRFEEYQYYKKKSDPQKIITMRDDFVKLLKKYQIKHPPQNHLIKSITPFLPDKPNLPLSKIPQQIEETFGKYPEIIKEGQMRLLANQNIKSQEQFIIEIWQKLKAIAKFDQKNESLVLDMVNYFLHPFSMNTLLILQIFKLFCSKQNVGHKFTSKYQALLQKLIDLLCQQPRNQVLLDPLYQIFELMNPIPYIDILTNYNHSRILIVHKLTILYNILSRYQITQFQGIINYAKRIYKQHYFDKQERQLSLRLIGLICEKIGEEKLMQNFKDLPTANLLQIQTALKKINKQHQEIQPGICKYCKLKDSSFTDPDIYDLHCFRDCIYLTKCNYCESIVQIPDLNHHYIKECSQSKNYKKCENCGLSIHKSQAQSHPEGCVKKQIKQCPLCHKTMTSKVELDHHILGKQCENNLRGQSK